MPVVGLTLKQIRQLVARNLMGADFINSAPTATGSSATTLVDDKLLKAIKGDWILGTGGDINGDLSRVESFEATAHELKVFPALSATPDSADSYEKFDAKYPPELIKDAINQAIYRATGKWYAREESFALHADGATYRFDLPSEFDMVDEVQYRNSVTRKAIHACDAAFDETVDSDITVTVDTEIKKRGSGSCKFVVGAGISNGDIATDSIASLDISKTDTIEFWVRCTTAVAASDLAFLLDDTASCASPLETLTLPAIAADTWTLVRLTLANPESDTAIISIGLEYNANAAANTIWIDDIGAVAHDSADWRTLNPKSWYLDKEAQDLLLTLDGKQTVGYSLLKIKGGSNPTALSADTDVSDLPEGYLVEYATARAQVWGSAGREQDQDDRRGIAAFHSGEASAEARKFPALVNARKLN